MIEIERACFGLSRYDFGCQFRVRRQYRDAVRLQIWRPKGRWGAYARNRRVIGDVDCQPRSTVSMEVEVS